MKKALLIVSFAIIASTIQFAVNQYWINAQQPPATHLATRPAPIPPTKEKLLELVNQERAKVNAPALTIDTGLEESAQFKANHMNEFNYIAHEDPSTGKNNGLDVAKDIMNTCSYISENIYWGIEESHSSEEAVLGWLSSKPHKEAMLDPTYTTTGFGISGNYIAQHFCRP